MNNPNPYQAPETLVAETTGGKSRRSTVRRPLSVWIALALLILLAIIFLGAFASSYYYFFTTPAIAPFERSTPDMVKRIAIGLAVELPILAIPVVAIWGIIRRSQLGRWMGIAALLLLFAAIVLGQMVKPSHANLAEYANDAERAGAMTAKVVMTGLYLALVYRFGFGSKARAYFAPRPEDDDEGTANKYW